MEPLIIPNSGCVSFDAIGEKCRGSEKLDIKEWCKKCLCFKPDKEEESKQCVSLDAYRQRGE